jgi:hypothetical protein
LIFQRNEFNTQAFGFFLGNLIDWHIWLIIGAPAKVYHKGINITFEEKLQMITENSQRETIYSVQ